MPEISRRQFTAYLIAVVLVVLLGGRALRADAGPGLTGAAPAGGFTAQAEPGTGASGPTGGSGVEIGSDATRSLVHVAGAVRRPGVYELPPDARVRDAVARAGGGRAGADLDALNLAAKVTDGQQVLVGRRARGGGSAGAAASASPPTAAQGPASGATGAAATASGPVNVNQADATQLEALNGVGPAIAQKIVEWRTQNGPFKSPEDLAQVSGIGPKKLEAMRAQVIT